MRRIYLKIATAFVLGLSMSSCQEEFLETVPQGQFSTVDLANGQGVEGLLLGAYAMIDGYGLDGQSGWNGTIDNWVYGGVVSDDAYKGTDAGDQPEQSFLEAFDFQPTNLHLRNKWRAVYKGVAKTNDVLNTLKVADDVSDERRAQVIAEARFLRGFFHMEARKMWRMVPYIDDNTFDLIDLESSKVPNDKEIWPDIEADFEAAMNSLPESQVDVGRPTKWAAQAFLAKAKMFQGWDQSTGEANTTVLAAAKTLLDDILNNGPFALTNTFEENFLVGRRNNEESIFEIQFSISSATTAAANEGTTLNYPYTDPWGCCGFYQPSQNLVNAFKTSADGLPLLDTFNESDVNNDQGLAWDDPFNAYEAPLDPRLDHTVGRRGILYKRYKIHGSDFIRDQNYAGPYSPIKHVAEPEFFGIGSNPRLSANNYRIMRLDMVILWLAEAEVELGNLERARTLVNLIRTRAANPEGFVPKAIQGAERNDYTIIDGEYAANYVISTYDMAWTDQDVARKAVRMETRLEFAMEGHRFFDLQRWGISAETMNEYLDEEGTKRTYLSSANFDKGVHEYFPVPLEAIERSFKDGSPTLVQDPAFD
ncbi:RagB/SusD family nutrient uptake outer membrane protein [Cyclobacterium qasimii]|uniref:Glycan metabolism protein RagB n=2 Tax=Cyclobacterium qasimii TaxID=1350429 RepID=A0A512C889_9BACT|nr:RagB/SusD family nutrient uptake outer membrane protein [Cyclobacterium qasimii]EPR69054.1 putative nutrient binding outer membrane protein [Cyclobacterium qasimii M12-11B]GEO20421.1 glycan metabolism protein RagB [Cyclobacterium qasimii]